MVFRVSETTLFAPGKRQMSESIPHQSEGCPRTGYFIPGRDGTGVRQISGVVRVTARAYSVDFEEIGVSCKRNHTFRRKVVFRVAKRGIL